jgi:hypothetical protein
VSSRDPGSPRASRAARSARRRHLRAGVAIAVVVAVVAGLAWWVFGRSSAPSEAHGSPPAGGTVRSGNIDLLTFSVADGPSPYLAVVGTGHGGSRPAAIPLPSNLVVTVPGQGETGAADVSALPATSVQVALSNVIGTWTDNYAVMSIPQVQAVVERMGGITVTLPELESTTLGDLGPGTVHATGDQVAALLGMQGPGSDGRWEGVLQGFLAGGPILERTDLQSVSSLAAVQNVLDATTAAEVLPMPTVASPGADVIAQQPEFDQLLSSTWGTKPPVPVIVQNGNGEPGVGESVGRKIIPAGFRIVISQNATSFDVAHTTVIANGLVNVASARRARHALGVGLVQASRVPSGIADITIVVGKDYTA